MTQGKKQLSTTNPHAQTEPETMTEDEKDLYNGIIYSLFEEWVEELNSQTEAEKADELETLARFAELEGVREKSPGYMLFMGFRAGVGKGLELVQRMEQGSLERS